MSRAFTLGIVSDIHYASTAEQARGDNYEAQAVGNPALRLFLKAYRHFIWLRQPMRHNQLLDVFLERVGPVDLLVANGDYSCDSSFVGVSDDAACQSVRECLDKIRKKTGFSFRATLGDHELGKFSFVGRRGGMRLASFYRAWRELGIAPFWQQELGRYTLIGISSSLVALPVFESETLPVERAEWQRLRNGHLEEIRRAFFELKPDQRVLLFCHDPTALSFLWHEEAVRRRISQVEQTIIGHLHSNLILWKSRRLAGMPEIHFLGHSARRMSMALRQARHWKPFHVHLCPSLAGIELLKDGGYLTAELQADPQLPVRFRRHKIPR
jgi:hypothetical protein